ncbi:MAG: hypothetical protein ACR2PE_03875 [Porticoccus sp.]|jgi:hypothetical protein
MSSKKSIQNIFLVSNSMVAIVACEYIHEQSFKDAEVFGSDFTETPFLYGSFY